jgi:deoxyribodipyrimidine photo-lyase
MISEIDENRIRFLNDLPERKGPVILWISRDQRFEDNWALIYAQQRAIDFKTPLLAVFCLTGNYPNATAEHYRFMIDGLIETESALRKHHIPLIVLIGKPDVEIHRLASSYRAGLLVSDFSPLKISQKWKRQVTDKLAIAHVEIDAHNIIPCWFASPKQEYAAYTFRPRVRRLLSRFLVDIPPAIRHPFTCNKKIPVVDWNHVSDSLKICNKVNSSASYRPGSKQAMILMQSFIENRLANYSRDRNDPNKDAQSGLSPYLHFGHLSAQRLAFIVQGSATPEINNEDFLEELIVRRELSDNFCFYNSNYDSIKSFPRWAAETLDKHRDDPREHLYSLEEFKAAETHDPLWNAAQGEMLVTGKMPGYLRMYWAKKILEWTESPDEAMQIALYLNDRYSLDGRDPNGYAGIAWSLGGVHDRAWGERPVFGKIRYMSYRGSRSKFNVDTYVERIQRLLKTGSSGS